MRRLIENEYSKLEHLSMNLSYSSNYSAGTFPTKLPNNLKYFSLHNWDEFNENSSMLILNMERDCKNLKCLHLEMDTLLPNMIVAIGNIKSLVYLKLAVKKIENEIALKNVICNELPNLKALDIGEYCYFSEEMISNITRNRPDLVHLNMMPQHVFQIPDSLNSLNLGFPLFIYIDQFLPALLFEQPNKSIEHLDIRTCYISFFPNFIEELLSKFKDLKTIHCRKPDEDAEINSLFSLMGDHLKNGRKITIYLHMRTYYGGYFDDLHCKYILPDDLPKFEAGWRPIMTDEKCENLVLNKLIKEAIEGGNELSFLDEWWME